MVVGVYSDSCSVHQYKAQELCESRGGRSGLPVPNKPKVSVDVKHHLTNRPSV